MTLVYNDHPVSFYKRLDFVIFKTRLHKGYINNTMQRVRGRIKTPDWRKCLLPSSFLGNLIFCKIYVKKFRPLASQKEIIRTGHVVTMAGALISVIITIAIDSIKGLNLFNVFQSVLGFIAPPMATVFLFGIFWKRTTTMAANMALTLGTAFSMGVGILYLWVFPAEEYTTWPHFMMLSFYLFVIISAGMILVSLLDKHRQECTLNMKKVMEKPAKSVILAWALLAIVMVGLYLFFNGH